MDYQKKIKQQNKLEEAYEIAKQQYRKAWRHGAPKDIQDLLMKNLKAKQDAYINFRVL